MYIADTSNNRIRKVTVSTGTISTIAGTGTGTYSGDGDAATAAAINFPYGVTIDSSGTRTLISVGFNIVDNCISLHRQCVHR